MSVTWVSANGTVWPLDGSLGVTMVGRDEGVFSLAQDLAVEQRVGADGAVLLSARRAPQTLALDLLIDDPVSILPLWGSLVAALFVGGTLRYVGPSGVRELRDVAFPGADGSLTGQDLQFRLEDVVPVTLLALDPWWYGTAELVSIEIAPPTPWDAAIPWDAPIPWDGGDSFGVSVVGDGPAWPYWTLHGEITTLTVSVVDAGSWIWDTALDASTYGTVDHRPGSRSPRLGSELNGVAESAFGLWGLVDDSSSLDWGLGPGDASVVVGATGQGGSTSLSLWYEPRWLTPG